jgi:pimeloyl-ACP methyl ester carboxylesterase
MHPQRKVTTMSNRDPQTGYAAVNELRMYYEIHGSGAPLVLLHGGLGLTGMFGAVLSELAQNRRVIVVDLQGHGRTADIDRPIRYEWMADDIAALLRHFGIAQADLMGRISRQYALKPCRLRRASMLHFLS